MCPDARQQPDWALWTKTCVCEREKKNESETVNEIKSEMREERKGSAKGERLGTDGLSGSVYMHVLAPLRALVEGIKLFGTKAELDMVHFSKKKEKIQPL